MPHLLWHHILGLRFHRVLECGLVQPDLDVPTYCEPCPGVLFGRDPVWEKKAGEPWTAHPTEAFYRFNRRKAEEDHGGLGRIGVQPDVAPYDLWSYARLIGKSAFHSDLDAMCTTDSLRLTFADRISTDPVPCSKWSTVQIWRDDTWVDIPFEKHDLASPLQFGNGKT